MSRKNRRNSRKNYRKASRKASRKNYRKASRKASRKNYRKASRKNYRKNSRRNEYENSLMMGGKYDPMEISLDQGREYNDIHKNQHGGGALSGAPVDYEMRLDPALVPSSRTGPLDAAIAEIQGMSDFAPSAQTGGRRHRKSRKGRKASKKSRKASRKSKKSRKTRRMRGGALAGAPYNSPSMLLSPFQAAKAGTADFSNPLLKY